MSLDVRAMLGAFEPDELDALIETMVLAAAADGELGSEERALLVRTVVDLCRGTRHEASAERARLEELVAQIEASRAADGAESRLAAVRRRLPRKESRKAAFALAARVSVADGIVRTTERELLFELATSLEIDHDEAADLVKAVGQGSR
jgi:tellurite resistance protein